MEQVEIAMADPIETELPPVPPRVERVLAAGMIEGEMACMVERPDGTYHIRTEGDAHTSFGQWPPGQVEGCAQMFFRMLRMPKQ